MMSDESPGPGRWVRVRSNSGYHLALIAANGEVILWSENYDASETVVEALAIAIQSVQPPNGRVVFSERKDAIGRAVGLLEDEDRRDPVQY